jgi:hypothetical protein
MADLTPELRTKFLKFKEEYDYAEARLKVADASSAVVSKGTWGAALDAVPLTPDELKLHKTLIAMHSASGGELFAIGENE